MFDANISIEFNNKGELVYIMKGTLNDELEVNDVIKEKLNTLMTKHDTANILIKINADLFSEMDKAIQLAFENAVDKTYERYFGNETESEDKTE